jgi:hypothetical protein
MGRIYEFNANAFTFNANAFKCVARYRSRAIVLGRGTEWRVAASQEAVAQSQTLIFRADAVLARDAMRPGWLWPGY